MLSKISNFFARNNQKDFSFIIGKSSWALLFRFGTFISTYFFAFIVARLYGAASWGTYILCFTVLQILSIISLWGLDNLIVRTIAKQQSANNIDIIKARYLQSFYLVFIFSFLLAIALYLSAGKIATYIFHKPLLMDELKLISFGLIPLVLMNYHASCFRGIKNMTGFTIFKMLLTLLSAFFVLLFYFIRFSTDPLKAFLISVWVVSIISIISWINFSEIKNVSYKIEEKTSYLLSQSTPFLLTGSVFFILGWADNIFIGIFGTERDVGIYDTAFKISSASAVVLMAINAIQAPVFAELYSKGDHAALKRNIESSSKLLFYITLPLSILICIFQEFLLGIFGDEFKQASWVLLILTLGNFTNSVTGSVGILLQMTGRQLQYNRIVLIAAFINIALNVILIPRIGILGAAIASTVSKIFQNLTAVVYCKKVLGFLTIHVPGYNKKNA